MPQLSLKSKYILIFTVLFGLGIYFLCKILSVRGLKEKEII